ncbi:hypothetical protein M2336_001062 [Sphingobium sp. B1D7B]|nr:hypothetical protein [Sphingobium sp. B1D7B]MCW2404433.1 hypothetical protein [Sphingobium sp. B1D7B]
MPVLRADIQVVDRTEQRDHANVVVAHLVHALAIRRAVERTIIFVRPARIIGVATADADSKHILDDRDGDDARDAIVEATGPARLRGLRLGSELDLGQVRIAGVEDEHTAGRTLAIERALRTAQNLDAVEVEEADRRRNAEVGDHERHVVDIIADGRVAIGSAGAGAADAERARSDRLALALGNTRNRRGEVRDIVDVALLEVLTAERLDGERHFLQRLHTGLLSGDDDFVRRGINTVCGGLLCANWRCTHDSHQCQNRNTGVKPLHHPSPAKNKIEQSIA